MSTPLSCRAPAPGGDVGRAVRVVTRIAAVAGVAIQLGLLALELNWAAAARGPVAPVLHRQGGLLAGSLLLAAVGFWLSARIRPVEPVRNATDRTGGWCHG